MENHVHVFRKAGCSWNLQELALEFGRTPGEGGSPGSFLSGESAQPGWHWGGLAVVSGDGEPKQDWRLEGVCTDRRGCSREGTEFGVSLAEFVVHGMLGLARYPGRVGMWAQKKRELLGGGCAHVCVRVCVYVYGVCACMCMCVLCGVHVYVYVCVYLCMCGACV